MLKSSFVKPGDWASSGEKPRQAEFCGTKLNDFQQSPRVDGRISGLSSSFRLGTMPVHVWRTFGRLYRLILRTGT